MTTLQYLVGYVLHLNDNLAILAAHYGVWVYVILFLIIFCETGIVLAAFLPGDSLLFASGVVAASGGLNVYYLILILFLAAFIGNMINYQVGNMFGHFLFSNKNSKIFNHKHLKKTHIFYEKHGGKTNQLRHKRTFSLLHGRSDRFFAGSIGQQSDRKLVLCGYYLNLQNFVQSSTSQ